MNPSCWSSCKMQKYYSYIMMHVQQKKYALMQMSHKPYSCGICCPKSPKSRSCCITCSGILPCSSIAFESTGNITKKTLQLMATMVKVQILTVNCVKLLIQAKLHTEVGTKIQVCWRRCSGYYRQPVCHRRDERLSQYTLPWVLDFICILSVCYHRVPSFWRSLALRASFARQHGAMTY